MAEEEKKRRSFTSILVMTGIWALASVVIAIMLNKNVSMFEKMKIPNLAFGVFVGGVIIYLIYVLTKEDKHVRLRGKSSMENQRFATIDDLNRSPRIHHFKWSELDNIDNKTLKHIGLPFRFERIHGGHDLSIHFTPDVHVLIVGASGTGKTQCWVLPTVQILSGLKNRPSIFVTDPKGEIYELNSLRLKNQGYNVLQLDLTQPYASKRWNPLENIYLQWQKRLHLEEEILKHTDDPIKNYPGLKRGGEINDAEWYEFMGIAFPTLRETLGEVDVERQKLKDDCMEALSDIAGAIVPTDPDPKNKQWTDGARDYFEACLVAMLEDSEDDSLGMTKEKYCFFNAYKIALNKDDDYEVVKDYFSGRDPLSKAKELSTNITQTKAQVTRDGYMSTLTTQLTIFSDNGICFLTSANDIKFTDFDERPTAFFIKIPDERATRYKLASVCISQAYKEFVQKARTNEMTQSDHTAALKRPVFYILDEFANMPKIESLDKIITVARSRRIFLSMAIQSYSQLDNVYGKEVAEIVRGQCRSTIFYGTPDLKTREEFSKELGNKTIEVDSRTKQEGSGKERTTHSTSTSLQQVPLIHPSELNKIAFEHNITNNFQEYPCKGTTIAFYKNTTDKGGVFTKGSIPPEFIPGRTFKESEVFYDIRKRNELVLNEDDDD